MNQIVTTAIVLSRTNFQEADRILTMLTPDQGKIRVMAKGVRKQKSKLAGGIELLSISEVSFIRGRGEIATLTSSRLQSHFNHIVKDMDRTASAYELLKNMNHITEDNADSDYFHLLAEALQALNDGSINLQLVRLWLGMRLLYITGHTPNLQTTTNGQEFNSNEKYNFDVEKMEFQLASAGVYKPGHIKLLRLARSNPPIKLQTVSGIDKYIEACQQLVAAMLKANLRI